MSRFEQRSPPDIHGMHSLKVDNLSYSTRPSDLEKYFGKYGEIGDIYIPRDPRTSESRGFAFVRFFRKRDAEDALDRLDGKIIDGREIRVAFALYARPPQDRAGRPYDRSRSPSRRRRTHSRSRSRDKSRRRERRTPSSASSRSRSPSLRRRSNSPPPKSPEGSSSVGGARSDARSLSK